MKSTFSIYLLFTTLLQTFATVFARKVTNPSKVPKNAVLLSKVASLTLRGGKLTTSRRVKAVPQLECVGPKDVCKLYNVDVMRCTNEGADYDTENIQWSCKASLPEEFKLGSTEVVCEGYESSDDPYVLKGSCAVEYRLLLTDKGIEKYRGNAGGSHWLSEDGEPAQPMPKAFQLAFGIIFCAVLFFILRGMWMQWRTGGRPRAPVRGPYGGGGGYGDDNDDPPPPYDGPPGYRKKPVNSATSRTTAGGSGTQSTRNNQQQQQWRPGFWTGTMTGAAAAAGYNAVRAQNRQQQQQARPLMQERQQPSSSFRAPSFSNERHESTGFGGTRRR